MRKDDSAYLFDILITVTLKNSQGVDLELFKSDYKLQLALVRLLEIVGEASVKLSHDLKDNYPNISWVDIKGLRNRIVHDYTHIRIDVIWNTVRNDIPIFKKGIIKIIEDINPQLLIDFQ